jgi:hypothetical protein
MLPRLEAVELSPGRFVRADPDGIQSVVAAALRADAKRTFNWHPQTQASQFFTNACECEVHCLPSSVAADNMFHPRYHCF